MSLAAAGLALSAVGTAVGVAGAVQQGKAAKSQAAYQAQINRNNAIVAEQNAEYAVKAGQQQAMTESLKGAAAVGGIKAAQGASGINVNTGSAVNVQESEREKNKLDVETVIHNAELKAYGYRAQARDFENQATLNEAEGKQAEKAGYIKGLGTILSGAGSVAGGWANANPSGASSGSTAWLNTYETGTRDYW